MIRGLKRNLVLLFAVFADVHAELSMQTVRKRFWQPEYKPLSVTQAISRMVRVGEIAREINDRGEVKLRLKAKGGRLLDEVLPLRELQRVRWDGIWRLVVFDIPEKRKGIRDALRKKLRGLGFGMWQKSVYVTPHNFMHEMNEYLEEEYLFPLVVCFESRRTGFGDDREFADLIFRTESLNENYRKIIDSANRFKQLVQDRKLSEKVLEENFSKLWMKYLGLVGSDPFLPFDLLPKHWNEVRARDALQRLAKGIH